VGDNPFDADLPDESEALFGPVVANI
jgi:hypothetical protein